MNAAEFLESILQLSDVPPEEVEEGTLIGSYIVYLLSPFLKQKPGVDFGFLEFKRKKVLVWTFRHPIFPLHSCSRSVNEFIRSADKCEECEFFYDLYRASFRIRDQEIKLHLRTILEKKRKQKDCNRCDDEVKELISKHPMCLGFDGELEMEKVLSSETAEGDFNRLISSFLRCELKDIIKHIGHLSAGTRGDFDVLGLINRGDHECVFVMENKFGMPNNLKDEDYFHFIDRHCWLSRSLNEFGVSARVISVWFSPYNREENDFFEDLEERLERSLDKQQDEQRCEMALCYIESKQEGRIIPCFGGFDPRENLEKYFLSPSQEWRRLIENHLEKLKEILERI
jgi:hypothetical protein